MTSIDVQRDMGSLLTRLYPRPDAVFNALHGRYGEDGCVQGLLNILEVPYTHSGMLASALAMDKPMSRHLFAAAGITVPEYLVVGREDVEAADVMPRPYVVKPVNEGSSVGVHIIGEGDDVHRSRIPAGRSATGSWSNASSRAGSSRSRSWANCPWR